MDASFSFEDAGRHFACRIEQARSRDVAAWWWFTVSTDTHRYAPFHTDPRDTEDSVRSRVVAYYDELLMRRAAPRQPWGRGERPAVTPTPAPSADAGRPADASPSTPAQSSTSA